MAKYWMNGATDAQVSYLDSLALEAERLWDYAYKIGMDPAGRKWRSNITDARALIAWCRGNNNSVTKAGASDAIERAKVKIAERKALIEKFEGAAGDDASLRQNKSIQPASTEPQPPDYQGGPSQAAGQGS